MYTYLQIGPMQIAVESDFEFPWTEDAKVFRIPELSDTLPTLNCKINFVSEFSPMWGDVLYSNSLLLVMDIDHKEHRICMLPNCSDPVALTIHSDASHIQLYIDHHLQPFLKWDRNLTGMFSLEHFYLAQDAFLLHASYIIHNEKAIIFTAPSGTGKSTQADLWQTYEDAEIINGDRTLLMHKDGTWYACGFPVCGSSEYCKNKTVPLKAIVCLSQGPENKVTKPAPSRALKAIYSQSFVNHWNAEDCDRITTMITSLISSYPIYEYECTKESQAVYDLKKVIYT